MSKTAKWVIGIITALVFFFGLFVLTIVSWIFSDENDETTSTGGEKIAVVELKEPIVSSEDIVRQFKKYRENKSIRAIVFRVESPGGGVAASQEIYEEVKKLAMPADRSLSQWDLWRQAGGIMFRAVQQKLLQIPERSREA
jgi:protease-4